MTPITPDRTFTELRDAYAMARMTNLLRTLHLLNTSQYYDLFYRLGEAYTHGNS